MPLLSSTPRELGVARQMAEVHARLRADPSYVESFARAFPERAEPIDTASMLAALASFERTLLSFAAPYDAFLAGDTSALDQVAQRGKQLFESERLHCAACHQGRLLTDAASSEAVGGSPFHNIGLYNLAGRGLYPRNNPGLYELTQRPDDMGKFRTPSLRNVELTAPYMHDGSIASLDEVLDHYAAGGRTIVSGPYAGVGADNVHKDRRLVGFTLTAQERAQLLAFLRSLTDPGFGRRFARPDRSARR